MKKLTTILVIVLVILGIAVLYNSSSAVLPDGLFGAPRPIPEDSPVFQEVNLAPAPSPVNQAPTVSSISANDGVLTLPNHTVELSATVRDDLLPSPHSVRATWSQLNGSGIVFNPSFNQSSAGEFSANTTATLPAVPGTYTIKLTASDGVLISQTRTINITLNEPAPNAAPTANIDQENFVVIDNNDDGSELLTVSGSCDDVNNNLASCKWYDGTTFLANDVAGNNTFNLSIATHPLTLRATDTFDLIGEDSIVVTVEPPPNNPPTANATVNFNPANVGQTITFNGSTSFDPDGTITNYNWNFGDNTTGFGLTTTHAYTTAGTYSASLTVTDDDNATDSLNTPLSITVNNSACVGNTPPMANAGPNKTMYVNQPVTLNGSASSDLNGNNTITGYNWNFGDGSTASGVTTSHAYAIAGTYTASLTVTDSCNASHTDQATITVNNPTTDDVVANFTISQLVYRDPITGEETWAPVNVPTEIVHEGTMLKFDASTSTGPVSFVWWTFGDGGTSDDEVAYHLYDGTGSFNAELTVFDPAWVAPDSLTRTITINTAMQFMDALGLADDASIDIAVWGSYAYTTHSTGLLTTINIASPTNLQISSAITAPIGRAIAASNGYVYVGASSLGLSTYTAAATPVLVNTYNTNATDGQSVRDLMARGKVVYMAAGPAGLKIMNMSNPANPIVVSSQHLPNNATAEVIYIEGDYAYIADTSMKVHIYDISMINDDNPTPANPTLVSTITLDWIVHQLAKSNDILVAQANPGGMHLYDISNPSNPVFITNYDFSSDADGLSPGGILAVGNTLYATMGQTLTYSTSVARVNLANPANPYIAEWLSLNAQVAGINRGPFFTNDDVYGRILLMANSKYKMVAVDVP